MATPPRGDTPGGIKKKAGGASKASRSTLAEKEKNLPLLVLTEDQRRQLSRFGLSEPLIDALQEVARILGRPPERPSISRTKMRAPLLDFLFPHSMRLSWAVEGVARIDMAFHAHRPVGGRYPRGWGLYSKAFDEAVRICFESAGQRYPKVPLEQYRQLARSKRLARGAVLRSTPEKK